GFGWLPPGALNYICQRMDLPPAEVFGVATFYHLFSVTPRPANVIHICDDIACRLNGAERICAEAESKVARLGTDWGWKRSPCLGQCERAPAALVIQAGASPSGTRSASPIGRSINGGRGAAAGEGLSVDEFLKCDPHPAGFSLGFALSGSRFAAGRP